MTTWTTPIPHLLRPVPARSPRRSGTSGTAFALLLLLTAVLFVRPTELIESWRGVPAFLVVMLGCLAVTAGAFVRQLTPARLVTRPAAACVIALLAAAALSHLQRGYVGGAIAAVSEFGKTVVYFVLLVAVLDTPARVHRFARCVGWLFTVVALVAVLQYHGLVRIEGMMPVEQRTSIDADGNSSFMLRIQAIGLFSDPNDLSLALCVAMVAFAHEVLTVRGLGRLACMAALPLLAYAFMLTHSRGGFLALVAAMTTYTVIRSGRRRAAVWLLVLVPAALFVFGGRQTAIDLNDKADTAQGRILLWREGLQYVRASPLFGLGYGRYAEEAGLVAHNSYVHCYGELGFFGGACFVGVLYCVATALRRATKTRETLRPDIAALLPCVAAMFAGYAAGMCSLSRQYEMPTYAVLGIAASYVAVADSAGSQRTVIVQPLSGRLLWKITRTAGVVLIGLDVFVRVFAG